jgi:argininosuccinate synthase
VEKPYSSDENLMHRSYEAGSWRTRTPRPPEDMFKLTRSPREAPDTPAKLAIHFKDAIPSGWRTWTTAPSTPTPWTSSPT